MMEYKALTRILMDHDVKTVTDVDLEEYMDKRQEVYEQLLPAAYESSMLSEVNWILRNKCHSGEDLGIAVRPGDICWLDYGQMYNFEMGYQHFGLVLNIVRKKALIIPFTSNPRAYENAYDRYTNPHGKPHLMRFTIEGAEGCGLYKNSTLFMNDLRFINTARIISVKGHIDPMSVQFLEIRARVMDLLFPRPVMN